MNLKIFLNACFLPLSKHIFTFNYLRVYISYHPLNFLSAGEILPVLLSKCGGRKCISSRYSL